MARRDQPYLPLYVQDFLTDERLAECSAQSTGVYIRLMCLMHKSEEYGKILLKQKDKQTTEQILNFASKLAKQMPYSDKVVEDSLRELVEESVLKIEGDFLVQKRMVKDNEISINRSLSGKTGGETTQKKLKQDDEFAKASAKAKLQANSEYETETKDKKKGIREKEKDIPTWEQVVEYFKSLEVYRKELEFALNTKYEQWIENKWKDGFGKPIINWKNTIRSAIPHLKPVYKNNTPQHLEMDYGTE